MSNPSIKKHMIKRFSVLANFEELGDNNSVIFLTASGLISGKITAPASDNQIKDFLPKLIAKLADDYADKYPLSDLDPYDGYVVLENAVIHSQTGETNSIPHLMVFIDQIIGVTVGEIH